MTLYEQAEQVIEECDKQLRLIAEQRREALKSFRACEEEYQAMRQKALDMKVRLERGRAQERH